ncbi:MAG TPA: patatin-like phospholipase family protein [Spirochaetota bacterium]|mgnify:CR=1 FL=1|nr:patatin-like phospholipase family protein [Spirochaetota bacterium]
MFSSETRKTIGIALGSGSSRGWAHIGVLEALDEEKIPVDYIAGCSVGSYIGVIYASGNLSGLKEFVLKMDGKKVFSYFDVVFPRSGFLDGNKKLRELVSLHTDAENFSDLSIPVMMAATDIDTGDKVVIKSGSILEGLRASMSFPGLFEPARKNGRWLVDGGLVDPVPVGLARAMGADIVIAVDLNSGLTSKRKLRAPKKSPLETTDNTGARKNRFLNSLIEGYEKAGEDIRKKFDLFSKKNSTPPHIIETVTSAIGIMQERITRINLAVDPPDILIQPRLAELSMMDFDNVAHAIEEGYNGMKEKIEDLKSLL